MNRLELPKFKEPKRKRPTVAAEDVPRILAALSPEWRPRFATVFFLGLRRGELLALQKEDIDLRDWTMTCGARPRRTSRRAATTEPFPSRSRCDRTSTLR